MMGRLIYAQSAISGIADSLLAQLDALTRHAFSNGKSFTVVITGNSDDGDVAAQTLWFSPQIPIQFTYEAFETTEITREDFGKLYDSVVDTGLYFLGSGPIPYKFVGEGPGDSPNGDAD